MLRYCTVLLLRGIADVAFEPARRDLEGNIDGWNSTRQMVDFFQITYSAWN